MARRLGFAFRRQTATRQSSCPPNTAPRPRRVAENAPHQPVPIPMNRTKSSLIQVNPPLTSGRTHSARRAVMLQGVAPYVAEMLHLKSLTINRVAGVAGFQTISHIWAIPTPTTGSVSVWTKIMPRTLLKLKQGFGIKDASPKQLVQVRTTRYSGAVANPKGLSSDFGWSDFGLRVLIHIHWQAELRLFCCQSSALWLNLLNESCQIQPNRGKSRHGRPRPCGPVTGGVAQTFLVAGSRNFPVPCSCTARSCTPCSRTQGTGDWKVADTRRPECRRYGVRPSTSAAGYEDSPHGSVSSISAFPSGGFWSMTF